MTTLDDDLPDAESVDITPASPGLPVDPPDQRRPVFASISSRPDNRRPIVPATLRSRQQRGQLYRWAVRYGAHTTAYHATRTPKYASKVVFWAPVGVARTIGRFILWATAEQGNWGLRQEAATRNDADTWLRLDHRRQHQASWRWWVVGAAFLAAAGLVVVILSGLVPWYARWIALGGAVLVFARLGRPQDKPITDRVYTGQRFYKLTAAMTRNAIIACGIAGIKEPEQIKFPQEIRRDGPGYLAVVDLPPGVEAVDVLERKGRLASGFRLPLDQVWPEPVPNAHTGRLAVWVGLQAASAMKQPKWPLLRAGEVDVFKPFPFATDPRLRQVKAALIYRNWLVGAMPGAGKTYALRLLLLAAALDPRVELRGYELKGSGDLDALEQVCAEYGSGADDGTIEDALHLLRWARQECARRGPIIKRMAKAGKAPENKVTPQLAGAGLGLHPVVIFIDECQELFAHPKFGNEAGELAVAVIKLGRALGIILLLATQRPDKESLPKGVSANVGVRFCLRVTGQVENDMILGTSMYKQGIRATQFGDTDYGWGWLVGQGKPAPVHSYEVDGDQAKGVVSRAVQLRAAAGTLIVDRDEPAAQQDVLADVLRVFAHLGRPGLHWSTLAALLAEQAPELYTGITAEAISARLRGEDVPSRDVKVDGRVLKGCYREAVEQAMQRRAIGSGGVSVTGADLGPDEGLV